MDADAATDPDALFAVEPDQFVAARNALVKALKQTDKARAAEVAAWKRPSATVWALNSVARRQPDVVAALFASAEDLKDAMAAGDATAMRDAQRRERSCLEDVVRAATAVLAESGQARGAVNDQRLRTTLQTAVVDDDAGEQLRTGRLDRDLDAPGFGFGLGDAPAPRPAVKKPAPSQKGERTRSAAAASDGDGDPDATGDAEAARRAKDEDRRRLRAVAHHEKLLERAQQLAERAAPLLDAADALEADTAAAAREADELARRAAAARAEADALAAQAAEARAAATVAVAKADAARAEAEDARPPA
jgi:hypothetical protein